MASAELVWLQRLLHELQHPCSSTVLWCDNLGATFLASNPAFHAREKVADGSIRVQFICSQDQLADALTKPLSSFRFHQLKDKLTVTCVSMRLRGHISNNKDNDAIIDTTQKITEL
jgi:hypothetical protein